MNLCTSSKKNLLVHERIVFSTKLNWTLYVKSLIVILIGFLVLLDSLFGLIFVFIGMLSAVVTYFKIKNFEFAVTNKRVLIKYGILRTRSFEIMLNKVEAIYVEQTIIGKIVNSGTMIIKGTGGSQNLLRNIDNPFQFRIALNQQIENLSLAR